MLVYDFAMASGTCAVLGIVPIMRRRFTVALFLLALIIPGGMAHSQTQSSLVTPPASLQHSLMKGLTYKVMTITTNMLLLRAATGSWIDAAILTSIYTGLSLSLFVANDYLWDLYKPLRIDTSANGIDFAESAKRTSLKFITYRTTFTALSAGILYLWTGSLKTTLTIGVALAIAKAAMFYVNDFAWDWYTWWTTKAYAH